MMTSNTNNSELTYLTKRYAQHPFIHFSSVLKNSDAQNPDTDTAHHGGLIQVELTNPKRAGSSVKVLLHGAHITSFHDGTGGELLYMSPQAIIGQGSKIRGGIPICFPQFASSGPLSMQHGFARQSDEWRVKSTEVNERGDCSVVLQLSDTRETRQLWNQHQFTVLYTVTLTSECEP